MDAASKAKDLQAAHEASSTEVHFRSQIHARAILAEGLSATKLGTANDKVKGLEAEIGSLAEKLKGAKDEATAAHQKVRFKLCTSSNVLLTTMIW